MRTIKLFTVIILTLLMLASNSYSQDILETTINAYAPEGHHFQGHNKYCSLATFNGNIYVFSMDSLRRPYINKIDEMDSGNIETALIDKDETDIYRVFDDAHHRFAIGIDMLGYIHIIGDMHHGNLGSKRDQSTDTPLPERFYGSIGNQMYWISDKPEDISSFSFVGFNSLRAIPCNGLTYTHIEQDLNGVLYMAGRQSVRNPRMHTPGTMGLSLWRYDIVSKSWEELGAIPEDNYDFSGEDSVLPSIVWEPHGYGKVDQDIEDAWYQSFSHSLKFDHNNRLHLLSLVNADNTYDGSTHVLYAYSDDGGYVFFRNDDTQINSLPIRATGTEENRGTILMTQGFPDDFDAEFFGLFWDRDFNPGFQYKQLQTQKGRYCYFDATTQQSKTADFNISIPNRQGDHCSLNNGYIAFIGTSKISIKNSFTDDGIKYSLSDSNIPSGSSKYLLREVDDLVLRKRNILRGLSIKNGQSIVISIDLNIPLLSNQNKENIAKIKLAQNQLTISFVQNNFVKIELYNILGYNVKSLFYGFSNSEMTFNLNELNLPSQVLILRVETPIGVISRKILVN